MDELEAIRARKLAQLQAELAARSAPAPTVLTDGTFAAFVRDAPVALVDFWAPWCAPCRAVSPIVEQLARDYADRLAVGKVNVDENPATANRFGIQSIPSLLVFQRGRMVDAVVGAVPRAELERVVQKWL